MRFSLGFVYLFSYNLLQFCGHTWILANMTARFLSFGSDAQAGTFYFVGVMMGACQLLSLLELFHIADGFEKCRIFPRLMQVLERNILVFLLISHEEFQSQPIICVQFYLWNILALLRYPHRLFCLIGTPNRKLLWIHQTLSIPVYVLCALTEGTCIYQMLPGVSETEQNDSNQLKTQTNIYILVGWLLLLAGGSSLTALLLVRERKENLESWRKKLNTE